MDIKEILKQAEGMQTQLKEIEEELLRLRVSAESGGGMVRATINGKGEIISLDISEQAYQEGREILAELVIAAVNNATEKMEEVRKDKQKNLLGMLPRLGGLG